MSNNEGERLFVDTKIDTGIQTEADAAYNVCTSVTNDKYSSEYEDTTDDDIGSILEEMSKLADVLSSSSEQDCIKSGNSSRNHALKEKSIEELLEEAEELIRRNNCCIPEKMFKSDEIISDCDINVSEGSKNLSQFDTQIFEKIREEVFTESENNKNSLECEKDKRFQDQRETLFTSSNLNELTSSNLNELFGRDSQHNWLRNEEKVTLLKNNLQKELTDVDENFFENVLKKYMEDVEDVKYRNSGFLLEESTSQSLKSLQNLIEDEGNNSVSNCTLNYISKFSNDLVAFSNGNLKKTSVKTHNPEEVNSQSKNLRAHEEITESSNDEGICELEKPHEENCDCNFSCMKHVKNSCQNTTNVLDLNVNLINLSTSGKSNTAKDSNSENERYFVNLTPRLELFADSIPKLMAEKSSENIQKSKQVINERKSKNSGSCNLISESPMNPELLSLAENSSKSSVECLKKVCQRKKFVPRGKILCKSNSNLISKVKVALNFRNYILKSSSIIKLLSISSYQAKDCLFVNYWKGRYDKAEAEIFRLRKQRNSKEKSHKQQIRTLRSSFDRKFFLLNKQNFILQGKMDELSTKEEGPHHDLEEHEKIENLRPEIMPVEENKLQAKISKLGLKLSELKQRNLDLLSKNEDINQQNSLLTDELKMFKEQLKEKNNFIAERLQAMTGTEIKLRKQIEDLKVDLNTKAESLKVTKLNYNKLEQTVLPLEKELLQLRVKEGNLHEKLAVFKNHAQREKELSQKLKNQVILDNNKIMDLTRQVFEMERIIKRKNPDSVSALILTANSDQDKLHLEKIKLLEDRNTILENEIRVKEEAGQQRFADFQKEFAQMKRKYAMEIVELENRLSNAPVKEKVNYNDMSTQTNYVSDKSEKLETCKEDKKVSTLEIDNKREPAKLSKVFDNLKSQNKKNDVHSIETICRMKLELSNKNKALLKLSKEFQELQKTNRRLQKEREKQLNDRRPVFKNPDSNAKNNRSLFTLKNVSLGSKSSDNNCNTSTSAASTEYIALSSQKCSTTSVKFYDPLQYSEDPESNVTNVTKKLVIENNILKEELTKLKKDFMALKSKRLADLNLLQEEHERELTAVIKKYCAKDDMSLLLNVKEDRNTILENEIRVKEEAGQQRFADFQKEFAQMKRKYAMEIVELENKTKT